MCSTGLADAGVERAVVNVHHFAEQIIAHFGRPQTPEIVISDERGLLLDTGGGVVKALPELGDAPFYHLNSDTIWIDGVTPNLARLAAGFEPQAMDALLLLAPTAGSIGYDGRGDFTMAADGRLTPRAASARWRPSSMPARRSCAVAVQRCAEGRILADHAVHARRRARAGCTACASKACGCTSARPRRSPRRKPRSATARG